MERVTGLKPAPVSLGIGHIVTPDTEERQGRQTTTVRIRPAQRRASELMIAATAASNQLPLYTANPDDFKGAEAFVEVVGIQARPNSP